MRGNKGFAKAVKNVILKTAEKKFITRDLKDAVSWNGLNVVSATVDVFGQISVGHNAPFTVNIINNTYPDAAKHPIPAQGVSDQSRNGDEIYGGGFMLRMQIENDANKHNNTWKFWLVEWNSVQGNPCNPGEFFFTQTGNNLLDTVQNDRWKAKLLGTYRTNARDVAVDAKTNILVKKWIPFRRKLSFRDDASIIVSKGCKEIFTIVGVCYDSSNTAFNTGAGNVRMNATFYYKDP